MTTFTLLRAIATTTIWSAALAPTGYVLISVLMGWGFDLSPVPTYAAIGAAFGLFTATTMEFLPGLFAGRYPSVGIIWFTLFGVVLYVAISFGLGNWLYASNMKEGLMACTFYAAFTGVVLYVVSHSRSEAPMYMFTGMTAGFMFQPLLAATGFAAAADLQQSLYGYLCAFFLSFIHHQTLNRAYDRAYKR